MSQAPSRRNILAATAVAFLIAVLLLVTAVLPAEYGIDPIGVGNALGLVQLAQVRPGVVTPQADEYKLDSREFVLGPYQAVEYKYRMEKGATMIFSWQATGTVASDLHSEPAGAAPGYAESFDKQQGAKAEGTYTAPFTGIHGWYWENVDRKDVRITLNTAGFYSGAQEFFDGGVATHELLDIRGHLVKPPAK